MRTKIIAGNWKMTGNDEFAETLIKGLIAGNHHNPEAEVVVCPPFTSLFWAAKLLDGSQIALGAQDMSEHESGAYTGEVSGSMLLTLGVKYVILGHSERRQYHAETDDLVNRKALRAFATGLLPIICVGETLEQREANRTEAVVAGQVKGCIAGFDGAQLATAVVAYEPVWAIGTGKTASPDQAQEVHALIRSELAALDAEAASKVRILYGGSVKPGNARSLLEQPDIDGALVGGASLKAEDFCGIINPV